MAANPQNNGKPKTQAIKDEIDNSAQMTIVLNGDGTINSITGGGHTGTMTAPEFKFTADPNAKPPNVGHYLDCSDYGDYNVLELLDMKSYTLLIMRVKDKTETGTEIKKYIWESVAHWW